MLFGALLLVIAAAQIVGWIRRHDQLGGLSALLVYLVLPAAPGCWSRSSCHTATSAGTPSSPAPRWWAWASCS